MNESRLNNSPDADARESSSLAAWALLDACGDLLLLLDKRGNIMAINRSGAKACGKEAHQMEGTLYWDYLTPETALLRKKHMKTSMKSGESTSFIDLTGDTPFEISCHPVCGPDGDVQQAALIIKDISEQVETKRGLVESEGRHRRLFNENPVPMYIYDTDSLKILEVNAAMVKSYGYTRDELTSMTISDIRPLEDISKVTENVKSLKSKQVYLGQWRHTKKDGSVIDVEITSGDFPYGDRPARLVLCQDVTAKVRIQQILEERELQYRHLFELNPFPILVIDPEKMEILNVNLAAIKHYGFEKEEFLGLNLLELRPPEDVEIAERTIRTTGRQIFRPGVFRHLKKDGTVILVDISSHEIYYEGRKARLVLCNDVTEQVQARNALQENEEKFRKIFFTSPEAMTISDPDDGALLEVNESFIRSTKFEINECLGQSTTALGMWVDKMQRDELTRRLMEEGRAENFEVSIKVKDGSLRNALVSATTIKINNVPRILSMSRDITDLKKTEEALLKSEEQLRASLGEKEILLKEIHHRVKNNLQVISGLLDLQSLHTEDEKSRQTYKESQNRIITMALIHEELYQSVNLSKVDFADYIQNLCKNLIISYGILEEKIRLEIEAEETQMVIDTAIPCGLIINELISNAFKHAFPGVRKGTVRLKFGRLKSGEFLFSVTDDGVGMPKDIDIHSTRTLGLHLVTVLVTQLGGAIKVNRGKGTSITVRFREYHEAGSVLY